MKTKWKSRKRSGSHGWPWSRLIGTALASMLALGCVIAAPLSIGTAHAAEPLDLTKACTLQVKVEPKGMEEGKEEAPDVTVDLYLVADAVKMDGYDAYTFQKIEAFAGLGELNIPVVGEGSGAADWEALSQQAAAIVFAEGNSIQPTGEAIKKNETDVVVEAANLKAGLYLMVPRGTDMGKEDYLIRETVEAGGAEGETPTQPTTTIRTIAYSDSYTFTYSPQLVALPAKAAVDGNIATSNQGDWIYEMTGPQAAESKPALSERFGALRIDKELTSYLTGAPATFVYKIEATLRGQTVYSNVVSLTFNAPGTQSELIVDRIPVGAEVTVEEVYTGAVYRPSTGTSVTLTLDNIAPEEEGFDNIAAFANEYDGTGRNGSAITNHFEYGNDADGQPGWIWTQIPAAE